MGRVADGIDNLCDHGGNQSADNATTAVTRTLLGDGRAFP
jgi:hypothetical protein